MVAAKGVGVFERATAGDDDLGRCQLRTFLLGDFGRDEAGDARIAAARDGLDSCRTAGGFGLGKGGAAHGDDLLGVRRLHGGNRVAGVDRPGEGVGAFNREDVRDLHHVEQGSNARRDVLAVAGGGRQDECVVMVCH